MGGLMSSDSQRLLSFEEAENLLKDKIEKLEGCFV
jgi:hypothetical protein